MTPNLIQNSSPNSSPNPNSIAPYNGEHGPLLIVSEGGLALANRLVQTNAIAEQEIANAYFWRIHPGMLNGLYDSQINAAAEDNRLVNEPTGQFDAMEQLLSQESGSPLGHFCMHTLSEYSKYSGICLHTEFWGSDDCRDFWYTINLNGNEITVKLTGYLRSLLKFPHDDNSLELLRVDTGACLQ